MITFGSRNGFTFKSITDYSFVVSSKKGLTCIPKPLLYEYISAYEEGLLEGLSTQEIRDYVKVESKWMNLLHNQETHLKGLLDVYINKKISRALFEVGCSYVPNTKVDKLPTQLLLQGPPGTGKSHQITHRIPSNAVTERIVCHPEMTNAQFIGSYRPQSKISETEEQIDSTEPHQITY